MASTQSTATQYNKFDLDEYKNYAKAIAVNTGNMEDEEGKIVKGKYVSARIFNTTYTLDSSDNNFEETAILMNYDDGIALVSNGHTIYGNPNKFIYDLSQQFNNCGIETALNILSIAGKIDVAEPSQEIITKLTTPYVTKVKDKYHNWVEVTVTPTVDVTSTEELLTLYAIKKDYCVHSNDIDKYKTAENIHKEDGGTFFHNHGSEETRYHDSTQAIINILSDYGIDASVKDFEVLIQGTNRTVTEWVNEGEEVDEIIYDESGNPTRDSEGNIQTETATKEKHEDYLITYRGIAATGDVTIDDIEYGSADTIVFNDLTIDEIKNNSYKLGLDGRDLIIRYSPTSYIRVVNYTWDKDEYGNYIIPEEDDRTRITSVKCAIKDDRGNKVYTVIDKEYEFTDETTILAYTTTDTYGNRRYVKYNNNISYYCVSGVNENGTTLYKKFTNGAEDHENPIIIKQHELEDGTKVYAKFAVVTEEAIDEENNTTILGYKDSNEDGKYYVKYNNGEGLSYYCCIGTDASENKIYRNYINGERQEGTNFNFVDGDTIDGVKSYNRQYKSPEGLIEVEKDGGGNAIRYEIIGYDKDDNAIFAKISDDLTQYIQRDIDNNIVYYYFTGTDEDDNELYTKDIHGEVVEDGEGNIIQYDLIGKEEDGDSIFALTNDNTANQIVRDENNNIIYYYNAGVDKDNDNKKLFTTNIYGESVKDADGNLVTYYKAADLTGTKFYKYINGEIELNEDGTPKEYEKSITKEYSVAYDTYNFRTGENSFVGQLLATQENEFYTADIIETNNHKYGAFLETLATYVKEGRGIELQGCAQALQGNTSVHSINHAILLCGVEYEQIVNSENLPSVTDIAGFYVVDTGGFLGKTGAAQFITCTTLYNFITASTYDDSLIYHESYDFYDSIMTDNCIKSWADELNLTGNNRRNTLIGNNARNTIRGGEDTDILMGSGGDDVLYGDSGADWLYGDDGNDTMYGGTGDDTYVFTAEDIYEVTWAKRENGEFLDDIENITFRAAQNDVIIPGAGRDTLRFENWLIEDLEFYNKNGDLVIYYPNSCLYTYPDGTQEILEGDGNKSSITVKDYFKKNLYSNLAKIDDRATIAQKVADNQDHSYNLQEYIQNLGIANEIDENVKQNYAGNNINETIHGGKKDDTISAMGGNDEITPGAGNDTIKAGSGQNTINLQYGNNKIYGETAENTIKFAEGTTGFNTIYSSRGQDFIDFTEITWPEGDNEVPIKANNLKYAKKGNDLSIVYDDKGSSVTITNYFLKQGNTSVKSIKFKVITIHDEEEVITYTYLDLVANYNAIAAAASATAVNFTSMGQIIGNEFDNVIKGSTFADIITGGLGCDKMYGRGGNNSFIFTSLYDGADTIYASGMGQNIIDLSATGAVINGTTGFVEGYNERYVSGDGDYAYSKSGNNLIINYGKTIDQESMSCITINNYFTSKSNFLVKDANNFTMSLSDAAVVIEGNNDKQNKTTGTKQDDIIFGGNLKDVLKGGAGNDTITAGGGDDKITGGAGRNTIIYEVSENGNDSIYLTKGESLTVDISAFGFDSPEALAGQISISGKDMLIKIPGDNYGTIKLMNFAKSDVTTSTGSVTLLLQKETRDEEGNIVTNEVTMDLRKDNYLNAINDFSSKKKTYSGSWLSETIDASALTNPFTPKYGGVSISGGAGDDSIIGSAFNDTIKGGEGDDSITAGSGKNTVDGGNGSDTYHLFENTIGENSIIKDTGKNGNDTAIIYTAKEDIEISFNATRTGTVSGPITIKSIDDKNNQATITNVENIEVAADYQNDGNAYMYNYAYVLAQVTAWLNTNSYSDVNTALAKVTGQAREDLFACFNNGWQQKA